MAASRSVRHDSPLDALGGANAMRRVAQLLLDDER
jgi:hypothetical protein